MRKYQIDGLKADLERFWSHVAKNEGTLCWGWTGGTFISGGYGRIWFAKKLQRAHVISALIHFGPKPEGLQVLHKCDNPPCVNPDHLYYGTQKENVWDSINRGRYKLRKLTPDQALYIRHSDAPASVLGPMFGVSPDHISNVRCGKCWSHLSTTWVKKPNRKLTRKQVLEIRNANGSQYKIAEQYGINQSTVSAIKTKTKGYK